MKNILHILLLSCIAKIAYAIDISTFVIVSKQQSLLNHAEILANNIANISTSGFKENKLIEKQYLAKYPKNQSVSYVNDISVIRNMSDGDYLKTENTFDIAITGKGFFMVNTNNGIRYTRAGHFIIDAERRLTTVDGHPVVGFGGEDIIIPESTDINVKEDGTINVDNQPFVQLGIAAFANENMLEPEGTSLFRKREDTAVINADPNQYRVLQGFLELSNVNKVMQLTNLIKVQRDIENISHINNTNTELSRNVISTLGKY